MLIVVLCTVALGHLALGQEPLVTTSQGTMKGKVLKSRDGRDYFSFTKIPFAKPPLGPLRFMISEKSDNWTGVLDATQETPSCYQPNAKETKYIGQEDCLYLNIFTPNLTGRNPVIFSIFGGGFQAGSPNVFGSSEYFMDEDVVYVAINHRLGTIGFMSLEDNVIPGNMGLKDQALALEWVHKEISSFGGDPSRITVIGGSSGGASSDLICSAPRTNGLIKGCVSQSGVASSFWAIMKPGLAREMGLNIVKAVGCAESNDLLKCLQSKPIEIIGNNSLMVDNTNKRYLATPVLEHETAPGAFLTRWPTNTNHNYPWILGLCQDDGIVQTINYELHLKNQEETDKFINSFNDTLISTFHLEKRTKDVKRMRERFFTEGIEPLKAIRNFYTEYQYEYPALKSISGHPGQTYFFMFNSTRGPPTVFTNHLTLAPHGSEMPYFYNWSSPNWMNQEDLALSKQLVKMWVNFARDQKPSIQGGLQWPEFQGRYYLDIQDAEIKISNMTDYQGTLEFWKSYIPDESKPDNSKSSKIQSSLFSVAVICISSVFKAIFG